MEMKKGNVSEFDINIQFEEQREKKFEHITQKNQSLSCLWCNIKKSNISVIWISGETKRLR